MSTSLESQILLAIWTMYQRNQISMEQKGCIKDLLIRKDNYLYSTIYHCKRQDQIEERLIDILNCIYNQFGLIRVLQETWMLKKIHILLSDQAINQVLLQLLNPNVIILKKGSDLRVQIIKVIILRISLELDLTLIIINEFFFVNFCLIISNFKQSIIPFQTLSQYQIDIYQFIVFKIYQYSYSNYYQIFQYLCYTVQVKCKYFLLSIYSQQIKNNFKNKININLSLQIRIEFQLLHQLQILFIKIGQVRQNQFEFNDLKITKIA
ncbi:unnamed protein product [Paramecium pentaurelia]|uniref:Uncharacterized protein n=1 Tax=Paramecium pentaurelia TaxID=43138 RepID=A0A8S1UXF5_9CILI|nr:unnamed protein product [Paramecium pentaurelia]